jgi:hypothetical protein
MTTILTALLVLLLFALSVLLLVVYRLRWAVATLTNDLALADKGLRWFGIRGNWRVDGGRDKRPAWHGGWAPWLRARQAMGERWTPDREGAE